MLDGLELADGTSELNPHLGVFVGRVETPPCPAGVLGGHEGGRHLVDPLRSEGTELPIESDPGAVDLDLSHPPGRIEAGQLVTTAPPACVLRSRRHHTNSPLVRRAGTSATEAVDALTAGARFRR